MKRFLSLMILTSVHFISTGAFGNDKFPSGSNADRVSDPEVYKLMETRCERNLKALGVKQESPQWVHQFNTCLDRQKRGLKDQTCPNLQTQINSTLRAAQETCGTASAGFVKDSDDTSTKPKGAAWETCVRKAAVCNRLTDEAEDPESDTLSTILSSVSSGTGMDVSSLTASQKQAVECLPTREDATKLTDRLDKLHDQTQRTQEKIFDAQKKYNEEEKRLNDEMNSLSENLKKSQSQAAKDSISEVASFNKKVAEINSAISAANTEIFKQNLKRSQVLMEKEQKLAKLNSTMINLTCRNDAKKLYMELLKQAKNDLSSGAVIKQEVNVTYTECVQQKLRDIDMINKAYDDSLATLDADIKAQQAAVATQQQQLTQMQTDFQNMKQLKQQEQNDELTSAKNKAQALMGQLQNLTKTTTMQNATTNMQLNRQNRQLSQVEKQIAIYGGEGQLAKAKSKGYGDVTSAYATVNDLRKDFQSRCCDETIGVDYENKKYCSKVGEDIKTFDDAFGGPK